MGSSYSIANATASLLSSHEIPAYTLNAGELLHYQISLTSPESLIICISQLGGNYEIIKLIKKLFSNITVLSICNGEDSSLVRFFRYSLLCRAGKEEGTSTKTFITYYQVAYLLVMKLCDRGIGGTQWHRLSKIIESMVNGDTPWMSEATEPVDGFIFVQLIGWGSAFAAVSQSALMFMEIMYTPASALLSGEFRHGPLEMVKKGSIAIPFAHSQSKTYKQSLSLVKDILKYEGKVIFIIDLNLAFENDNLCAVTIPSINAELPTVPCIVPVQLLINTWVTRYGAISGEFTHGAKITSIG